MREDHFLNVSLPSFAVLEAALIVLDLFTADTGNGGEHTSQLHKTGITSCLDVLKRVVGHPFVAFEGGKGHTKYLETGRQFYRDKSPEL
jgi:hypothetical protein